jgi:hypothetical protein
MGADEPPPGRRQDLNSAADDAACAVAQHLNGGAAASFPSPVNGAR